MLCLLAILTLKVFVFLLTNELGATAVKLQVKKLFLE